MTIPIDLAIRAVRLHIAMCDAGSKNVVDYFDDVYELGREQEVFIRSAHAGYKATLEFLLKDLEYAQDDQRAEVVYTDQYWAVRPLISHLDATRPNWRTE